MKILKSKKIRPKDKILDAILKYIKPFYTYNTLTLF